MAQYGIYIWASYGVVALLGGGISIISLLQLRYYRKRLNDA